MLQPLEEVVFGENVVLHTGCVLGKRPFGPGLARKPILPEDPRIHLGDGCVIGANAVIYAGVTIGPRTLIGDGVVIREDVQIGEMCVIGSNTTFNAHSRIGNRVKIMDVSHITADVLIEDDVFISTGVLSTNSNQMSRDAAGYEIKGMTLRRGASIGAGVIFLPGVEVGEGAIVAAGAVVTKDVLPGTTVMGIPARNV